MSCLNIALNLNQSKGREKLTAARVKMDLPKQFHLHVALAVLSLSLICKMIWAAAVVEP